MIARGNLIKVLGDEQDVLCFEKIMIMLQNHCVEFNKLDENIIIDIIKGNIPKEESVDNLILHGNNGKPIIARTKNQQKCARNSF
jgi:phosphate starvation-inducible PhoH-like protein